MAIKWNLKVLMAAKDFNNKHLAELTGLSENAVSRHRQGMPERLSPDVLIRYCKALGCQPGDLMEYVEGHE